MSSYTDKIQKERNGNRQPYEKVKKRPTDEALELVKSSKDYKAIVQFKAGEKSDRFRVIDAAGNIDLYNYNHLLESSYRNGMLTLITSTRSFVFSGRNLALVIDLLADQKVKSLCAFKEGAYQPMEDVQAIFIEGVSRE